MTASDANLTFRQAYSKYMTSSETACRYFEKRLNAVKSDSDSGLNNVDDIVSLFSAKVKCTESLEIQAKRMNHALKRLKEKRLWAETFSDVENILIARGEGRACAVIQTMHYGLGDSTFASAIADSTWKLAIELTMMICEPDLFASTGLFGSVIDRHLDVLYILVILLATSIHVNSTLADCTRYIESHEEAMTQMDSIKDAIGTVLRENASLESQTDAMREAHAAKIAEVQHACDKASRRLNYLETKTENQAQEIERLKRELAERDEELEAVQNLLGETFPEAGISNMLQSAQTIDVPDQCDGSLPELPERNIIFAGGHINMVNKIKQRHPDWRYIDCRDKGFSSAGSADLIFVWYKHISHPVFDKLQVLARSLNIDLVFLESTNLDNLESEMRRAYAARRPTEV